MAKAPPNDARETGRYRKCYPRIWRHPGFRALKPAARELALYILTGPQTNAIGLFCFSMGAAAEDLRLGAETLADRYADVRDTFGWLYDADARVMFIPSWWRWNRPENPNVLKHNLKLLSEIPPTPLAEAFARNLRTLPVTYHETFVECCRERLGEGSGHQDQEHFQEQFQEHEQDAGTPTPRAHFEAPAKTATKNGRQEDRLAVARYVLNATTGPIDHLIDAYLDTCTKSGMSCTRSSALEALNIAIAERRA